MREVGLEKGLEGKRIVVQGLGNVGYENEMSPAKVNLRKLWTAAYAEAGVPKGTRLFYSVRHNFGTEMANEGMPLPALANLLGHSDVKMTMRYYNMNKETIDKARDILNRRAVANS